MSVWTEDFSVEDYSRIGRALKDAGFDQPSLEEKVDAALAELRRLRARFRAEVEAYEAGLKQ